MPQFSPLYGCRWGLFTWTMLANKDRPSVDRAEDSEWPAAGMEHVQPHEELIAPRAVSDGGHARAVAAGLQTNVYSVAVCIEALLKSPFRDAC